MIVILFFWDEKTQNCACLVRCYTARKSLELKV